MNQLKARGMIKFASTVHFTKSSPLSTNAPRQLNVLWHDSNPLCMDGAEVGILEDSNEVCFRRLLQALQSQGLKAESFSPHNILADLPHEPVNGYRRNNYSKKCRKIVESLLKFVPALTCLSSSLFCNITQLPSLRLVSFRK